ncbi:MAG: PHB depolymerase family esterase [Myxococcota bacterium]
MRFGGFLRSLLVCALLVGCGDDDAGVDAGGGRDAGGGGDASGGSDTGSIDAATGDSAIEEDAGSGVPLVPTLPEVAGDCPDFTQDRIEVMGLPINVLGGGGTDRGPLVITWHGTGGSGATSVAQLTGPVRDAILAEGGMILAPSDDGTERGGFSPNGVWYETSDLAVADQLVACAVRDRNIDPTRIYVTGCSAGGIMGAVMTVQRADYVAAAFLNSGGLLFRMPIRSDWAPSVLTMHGGAGDVVVVNFQSLSNTMTQAVSVAGGTAIDCNHLSGHCRAPNDLRASGWEFVSAQRYGEPSPFAAGPGPDFPDYCELR